MIDKPRVLGGLVVTVLAAVALASMTVPALAQTQPTRPSALSDLSDDAPWLGNRCSRLLLRGGAQVSLVVI